MAETLQEGVNNVKLIYPKEKPKLKSSSFIRCLSGWHAPRLLPLVLVAVVVNSTRRLWPWNQCLGEEYFAMAMSMSVLTPFAFAWENFGFWLFCALPWIHTEDIAYVLCRWEDTVIQQMRARASCSSLNSLVAFKVETKISRFAPRWSWKFLSEWPRDMSWYVIAMVLWFGESFCQRSMTSQTCGTHTSDPPKQMKMGRNEGLNSCLSMRIYASLIKKIQDIPSTYLNASCVAMHTSLAAFAHDFSSRLLWGSKCGL